MSYNSISESDYSFVENPESDLYGIRLRNRWEDVIVVYGKVTVKESPETGYATLSFNYQVIDTASFQKDELESNEEFKNYLGDLLSFILYNKFDNEEYVTNENTIDSSTD